MSRAGASMRDFARMYAANASDISDKTRRAVIALGQAVQTENLRLRQQLEGEIKRAAFAGTPFSPTQILNKRQQLQRDLLALDQSFEQQRAALLQQRSSPAGMLTRTSTVFGVYALTEAVRGLRELRRATVDAFTSAVQLAANYQDASVSFKVMTGSAAEGARVLRDIQKFAIASPFKQGPMIEQARLLSGYGISQENLLPALKSIGDVTAGSGGGDDRFSRIALAYGQVISRGKFFATELRQFTEAGVAAKDFSNSMGVTLSQFYRLMHEGKLTGDVVEKAFNDMTGAGGRFFNMQKELLATPRGKLSSITESFEVVKQKFGEGLLSGLEKSGALDKGLTLVDSLADAAERFGVSLGGAFDTLGRVVDNMDYLLGQLTSVDKGGGVGAGVGSGVRSGLSDAAGSVGNAVWAMLGYGSAQAYALGSEGLSRLAYNPFRENTGAGNTYEENAAEYYADMQRRINRRTAERLGMVEPEPTRKTDTGSTLDAIGQSMVTNLSDFAAAEQFAEKIGQEMAKDITPVERYTASIKQLNDAIRLGTVEYTEYNDILEHVHDRFTKDQTKLDRAWLNKPGRSPYTKFLGEMQLLDRESGLSEDDKAVRRAALFDALKSTVSEKSLQMPSAAMAGSSEAAAIIANSQNQTVTAIRDVVDVLRETKQVAEDHKAETIRLADELDKIGKAGGFEKVEFR